MQPLSQRVLHLDHRQIEEIRGFNGGVPCITVISGLNKSCDDGVDDIDQVSSQPEPVLVRSYR